MTEKLKVHRCGYTTDRENMIGYCPNCGGALGFKYKVLEERKAKELAEKLKESYKDIKEGRTSSLDELIEKQDEEGEASK